MGLQAHIDITYGLSYVTMTDGLLIRFNNDFGSEENDPEMMLDEENWNMDKLEVEFPDLGVSTYWRNPSDCCLIIFAGDYTRIAQDNADLGSNIFPFHIPRHTISKEAQVQLDEFHKRYPADEPATWLVLAAHI